MRKETFFYAIEFISPEKNWLIPLFGDVDKHKEWSCRTLSMLANVNDNHKSSAAHVLIK